MDNKKEIPRSSLPVLNPLEFQRRTVEPELGNYSKELDAWTDAPEYGVVYVLPKPEYPEMLLNEVGEAEARLISGEPPAKVYQMLKSADRSLLVKERAEQDGQEAA